MIAPPRHPSFHAAPTPFAIAVVLHLVAVAAVLAAAAPAASPRARRALEPFDPRADYRYDLNATAAAVHPLTLGERSFEWPQGTGGDTAFLEIELVDARRREPAISVSKAGIEIEQVFEDGARGRRFVDLSPLLHAAAAGTVSLAGDGVRWRTGAARLFTFHHNPAVVGLRILVVAPRPDDAEIAAFGVYSSADADVVTVTSGDAGEQGFGALFREPGEHYRVKGWIRTWDSITVPFFGGVEPGRARNLGYYDATLGRLWRESPDPVEPLLATLERPGFYRELNVDPVVKARPFAATWPNLVADLAAERARAAARRGGAPSAARPPPRSPVHRARPARGVGVVDR